MPKIIDPKTGRPIVTDFTKVHEQKASKFHTKPYKAEKSPLEEDIDVLIAECQRCGMTLAEYCRATFSDWNKNVKLYEAGMTQEWFENFLLAVQHNCLKDDRRPELGTFNEESLFDDWLVLAELTCINNLERLGKRKKEGGPSYKGIVSILPDMENVPKGVGEPLSQEDYELYEELLRRQLEMFKKFKGKPELVDEYLKMDVKKEYSVQSAMQGS